MAGWRRQRRVSPPSLPQPRRVSARPRPLSRIPGAGVPNYGHLAVAVVVVVAGGRPPLSSRGLGGRGWQAPWPRSARPPRTAPSALAPTARGTASPASRVTGGTGPSGHGHTRPLDTQVSGMGGWGGLCYPGVGPSPRVIWLLCAWARCGTPPTAQSGGAGRGTPTLSPQVPHHSLDCLPGLLPAKSLCAPPHVPSNPGVLAVPRPTVSPAPPAPPCPFSCPPDHPGCPDVLSPPVPQTLGVPCWPPLSCTTPEPPSAPPNHSPQTFLAVLCPQPPDPFLCCPQVIQCPQTLPVPSGTPRPLSASCYPKTPTPDHPVQPIPLGPPVPPQCPQTPSATCYAQPPCHVTRLSSPPAPPVPQSLGTVPPFPRARQPPRCPQGPRAPCAPAAWALGCAPRVTLTRWWPTSASSSPLTSW